MSRGMTALKPLLKNARRRYYQKTGIPSAITPRCADRATPRSPVPCRTGKTRENFFRGFHHDEKARLIIDLRTAVGENPRRGRETAGKL
jgi:hypothetical protein